MLAVTLVTAFILYNNINSFRVSLQHKCITPPLPHLSARGILKTLTNVGGKGKDHYSSVWKLYGS